MTQQHLIVPPPELVHQWFQEGNHLFPQIAAKAAQWAADQELEACCAFAEDQSWGLVNGPHVANMIRAARRPKPKSLKEQALATLQRISKDSYPCSYQDDGDWDTIRRALEALPND